MFVPPSFPLEIRSKVRNCLFGSPDPQDFIVLTPIRRIFVQLGREMQVGKGWWETRSKTGVLLALTPQGSPMLDAISALEPGASIAFLGFAGTLGSREIGTILEADEAQTSGTFEKYRRSSHDPLLFPGVTVVSVSCFAESVARCQELALTSDCIDMETALIYAACERQKKHGRSILIVSDDFAQNPFYSVPAPRVDTALAELVNTLTTYLSHRE